MKMISAFMSTCAIMLCCISCTSTPVRNANASEPETESTELTSRIGGSLKKVKNYFKFHTSREHREEERAIAEAEKARNAANAKSDVSIK